ncbi:hypothetical protein [Mesoplasma florum]|uniref:hypothetical protein n=1 Tax=Mesoplasma florum TaxID=2151 RepID=UPI000BE455C1|nr:hypothetical protein [Mesoplasma florum]ATI73181.1 hypothetical protein CQZ69_01220 [Mesoplasma florum]AVN61583.1 hypothetical protein CG004_01220 [Mesoplasma florum]
MKKQENKILMLNIFNILVTILFNLLIIAVIIFVCVSLKQVIVAILAVLPIVSIISIIIFYTISYKKRKIGVTNLLLFMCSINIPSLLISYKIISELETLDIFANANNDEKTIEKNNLMADWEIKIEQEKIEKKLAKLNSKNESNNNSKKVIEQKREERKREIYKSYSKFVYNKIIKKYPDEKNTFKLISLTTEALENSNFLGAYIKQEKLINLLQEFDWTKEQVIEILNEKDIEQIVITFKENRKNF